MSRRLLKFSRPSCVPCQMVGNYLNDKGIEVEEINVYEDADMANKFNIQSVPVLILLNGEEVEEMTFGFNPPEIDSLLNKLN